MALVLNWFGRRFRDEASHLLHVTIAPDHVRRVGGEPVDSTALKAGEHYFRLWLVEMFLKNDRDWFSAWHPAVHAAVTFDFGDKSHVVTTVSGPTKLQNIKKDNLDKFITIDQPLTGLLPFNGGTVGIDAGLLAMKGSDDVKNLIKVMGDFGGLLMAPQLSAAMAVAGPLADGVGALVGATDGRLMIGINKTLAGTGGGNVLRAGYFAIVDAPADVGDGEKQKYWVDSDRLTYGEASDASTHLTSKNYMLFRIECRDTRDDWDELASIRDPYQDVLNALQSGSVEQAQGHLRRAITAALKAPELTKLVDRRRVVECLKARFEEDKRSLGASAVPRAAVKLSVLMQDALPVSEAARRPEMKAIEAFAGL